MSYLAITLSEGRWRYDELLLEAEAARRGTAVRRRDNPSRLNWRPSADAIRRPMAEGPGLLTSLRGMLRLTPTA